MIGKRVAQMRHQLGWSQAMLADKAGVRQATISKIELGRRQRIGVDTLQKIASAFSVDLMALLTEETTKDAASDAA